MRRAIFPLPIFLLPGGYTRLRIFEPRYLSMVGEALKNAHGFVLCEYVEQAVLNVPQEGVLVDIIDFSQDEGGQLLIDVYAKHRVALSAPYQDEQQLRYADVTVIEERVWNSCDLKANHFVSEMSEMLADLFAQHPHLDQLYREKHFHDPLWVASRWLELLPINISEKHKLRSNGNFEQVINFLHTVLYQTE
ncbi:LON peptidase substrate-binding domain-containing protein [Pseudoalteromonas sp. T1lg23B]|uniref:LON peptidase substrate-binding domain-containing protein n=1 Tax=Pseudoalteromonas sp. T1lg23B TaxID=2077097 RepID=UPI000CF65D60|nr:LON peptidase substrate-binding domain-containing protein [Pseudoalteromonas sp. T1lg23B]